MRSRMMQQLALAATSFHVFNAFNPSTADLL
jgi:hypothetical protein